MGLLSWIVVGLIAGWLAGTVMRGGGYGLIGDIVIGIVGALIAGLVAMPLFGVADPVSGINVTSIVAAFLGAVVLILILRLLSRRSRA